ncbi:MAG: HlyC/CorC family transporter [Phascolarctobacterium sp.]|nr:HlyC/CorC family transporter [Phascolarctobacterium sp.]MBQ7759767.1 HlyC/CorC family transporter [Acidaminococcaceae bacterium]
MTSDSSTSVLIIIFCILFSAYFSATETAFSSLNRIRIKNMAERGDKRAKLVLDLLENFDSLLSSILIGNNIVNIACASVATMLFVKILGEEHGASVSTIVVTIVVLIFGEVSPKSIAKENPEKFAMFSAPFLNLIVILLTPFNFLFKQWKKLLSKIFHTESDYSMTEEELLTIVEEAEQEGRIDEQESSLIRSAIEFSEQEAIDILTPRIDIVGVSSEATKKEIADVFTETNYSRLPVYKETMDHIIGIIYQKDFYNMVYDKEGSIDSIIRPAMYITESKKIGELLKELQHKKSHIAIVLDEYGGTTGIVTLEDILEELVGEIWDEHDEVINEIEKVSDTEYIIYGSTNLEDLFEVLDMGMKIDEEVEEMEVVTVSGWVMEVLGRIPVQGDTGTWQNLEISVLEMDENRVERIKLVIKEQAAPEEE